MGIFISYLDGTGNGWKVATMILMILGTFPIRVLEVMFFTGIVGSSVVVIISFIEDGIEMFSKDSYTD